jgi:hypothetical protein
VKLAAALPGMGNTGNECGGITGPLVLLGLRHARDPSIADERNAFNRAMNRGHGLARWFAGRFGSTRCRELTGCDFDTVAGVHQYIESDCATRCGLMAREVETQVHRIV